LNSYIDQQKYLFDLLKEEIGDIQKIKEMVQTIQLNKGFKELFATLMNLSLI
jgi:hypothetical protein